MINDARHCFSIYLQAPLSYYYFISQTLPCALDRRLKDIGLSQSDTVGEALNSYPDRGSCPPKLQIESRDWPVETLE